MKVFLTILLSTSILGTSLAQTQTKCELAPNGGSDKFPDEFRFGIGTSAYQIEGGWNAEGKAPSFWDNYTHANPGNIADRSNGDNAAESYYRFEQDLRALKKLKVNYYRFSIAWTRVLPRVTPQYKNKQGIAYYNKVIDLLLANNITPMVQMLHFDMPEELYHKDQGFLNSSTIDHFTQYADFLFKTFGDRVKLWSTHNEPNIYCDRSHSSGVGGYICMDNLLKSHALTYRLYKSKYYATQKGKVGITLNTSFFYKQFGEKFNEVTERAMQFNFGFLGEPIFGKTGNFPAVVISDVAKNSLKEGLPASRLPVISKKWSKIIKGSADFLGLNYYGANLVDVPTDPTWKVPSLENDANFHQYPDASWKVAKSDWLYCVPQGLEDLLKWIRDRYNNVEVIITENGWSDDGQLNDSERMDYIKANLQGVLNAINDGCHVTHYTYWSLIDNFEWRKGYTEKFGLFYVNMTRKDKKRVIKDSAKYYKKVIKTHKLY